ncbi:SCO family protein [Chitinophaga polysaccharea]|uniref:SCO family protein n=1 Tax=Chitinophaga TaxID=79328 RepID=UPI0014554CED|nr:MULTISPECIES: SCO family protein [Chitinophaga]NLR58325.1 SCO family protein [Chitinophaga polysaccharea]NLU90851.1 SCO family protein [Chitinophaga sp. Ak27]
MHRFHILHSWKAALIALIGLPLLAWSIVHWTENKFGTLPLYGRNQQLAATQKEAVYLPPFSFMDQDQQVVTNDWLQNRICVANFFFTSCPVVCPKMMHQLQRLAAADSSLRILSLTVDPDRDTPATLQRYGTRWHIPPQTWKLLTGNKKSLYYFARKGLYLTATDGDGGKDDFIHSDNIVLLDQQQRIRGYYPGTSASTIALLLSDIKKLQHEK